MVLSGELQQNYRNKIVSFIFRVDFNRNYQRYYLLKIEIIADNITYNIPVVDFSGRIGSCISWRSLLSTAIGRIADRERIPRAIRWTSGCNGRRFIGRYRLMFAHLMHGFSRLAAVRYYFIMLIVMLLCRLMVIVHFDNR